MSSACLSYWLSLHSDRTVYHAITIPGDDRQYFEEDHWEFHRKPHPLGMESGECAYPLNTWRNNNGFITSKRRHFDVITSKWRRLDVITTSLLRNVFCRNRSFNWFWWWLRAEEVANCHKQPLHSIWTCKCRLTNTIAFAFECISTRYWCNV